MTPTKIRVGAVRRAKIAEASIDAGRLEGLSRTFTHNFGNVQANSCIAAAVSIPGVRLTDHIVVTPPSELMLLDLSFHAGYGISPNFVRMRVCNPTGSSIPTGTRTYRLLTIAG